MWALSGELAFDFAEFWAGLQSSISAASAISARVWREATPSYDAAVLFLSNPWARAVGLTLIVYFTIRVIASVYSGDKQNSEYGPIGIRPHTAQRLDRHTVVLPRTLMPMNMDGVTADMKVYYTYVDARGKRRKQHVHTHHNARIGVSPVRLTKVSSTIFGQEVPDLATEDVCFPPPELDQVPQAGFSTPARALEYAALHKIVENWREDDDAFLVSVHADEHETIKDAREQFIVGRAKRVARARNGNALQRWLNRGIARQRPNVVGSYYLKFEFSHDPWFVLTRHPDRELKMTAWLTVLTSMFALVMDVWPRPLPAADSPTPRPAPHSTASPGVARVP